MGKYPRQEIEDAFAHYRETAARAAASGDWDEWAELFTEDATYVEHHYGRFEGRQAIRKWIGETMSTAINKDMNSFPVRWYVIDEDRGWVVCSVINRMADPGDGTVHEADSWTRLDYAGDGRFSLEEDMYNPTEFAQMIASWTEARKGR